MNNNDGYEALTREKKYLVYTNLEAGQTIIEDAKFVGVEKNKFDRLNFLFEKDGDDTIYALPQCASLKQLHEDGKLTEGDIFKIIFEGKKEITSGVNKGGKKNTLKILKKQK